MTGRFDRRGRRTAAPPIPRCSPLLTVCFADAQTASAVSRSQLMQPPPPRFQGIDLAHYLIGKNNVFAFLRREVCFRVITINRRSLDRS